MNHKFTNKYSGDLLCEPNITVQDCEIKINIDLFFIGLNAIMIHLITFISYVYNGFVESHVNLFFDWRQLTRDTADVVFDPFWYMVLKSLKESGTFVLHFSCGPYNQFLHLLNVLASFFMKSWSYAEVSFVILHNLLDCIISITRIAQFSWLWKSGNTIKNQE